MYSFLTAALLNLFVVVILSFFLFSLFVPFFFFCLSFTTTIPYHFDCIVVSMVNVGRFRVHHMCETRRIHHERMIRDNEDDSSDTGSRRADNDRAIAITVLLMKDGFQEYLINLSNLSVSEYTLGKRGL